MDILLLRHGIAVDAEEVGGDDAARTLSADGRARVVKAAQALRKLGIKPATIITSPLPRASETAELTARELNCEKRIRIDAALKAGAGAGDYAKSALRFPDDDSVMMVGHNPDMENFLAHLVSQRADACIELKKGGMAVVEVADPKGGLPRKGGGVLKALYTAKDLVRLAE